jgi:hypothetical protein
VIAVLLVDSVAGMMMHGLANPKIFLKVMQKIQAVFK